MSRDTEYTFEVRELKTNRYYDIITNDKVYDSFELSCVITPDNDIEVKPQEAFIAQFEQPLANITINEFWHEIDIRCYPDTWVHNNTFNHTMIDAPIMEGFFIEFRNITENSVVVEERTRLASIVIELRQIKRYLTEAEIRDRERYVANEWE